MGRGGVNATLVALQFMGYRCTRCSHEWLPMKSSSEPPRICPKCKSPYWDRPRRERMAPK